MLNSGQILDISVPDFISFSTPDFDSANFTDNFTNTTLFTTTIAGPYLIAGSVVLPSEEGTYSCTLLLNGASVFTSSNTTGGEIGFTTATDLVVGDTLEVSVTSSNSSLISGEIFGILNAIQSGDTTTTTIVPPDTGGGDFVEVNGEGGDF
jgi:hypothetical protein